MAFFNDDSAKEWIRRKREKAMDIAATVTKVGTVSDIRANLTVGQLQRTNGGVDVLLAIIESDSPDIANDLRELRHILGQTIRTVNNHREKA